MSTFLFDKIIFGPVKSRRLGTSLGINLLPVDKKICTFNCIYCECGWTNSSKGPIDKLPGREKISETLKNTLLKMQISSNLPDVITFAGNGEPTIHPEFAGIIGDTVEIRNRYAPETRIAVLSNATMLFKKDVFNALLKIDENIQKLDSANENTVRLINCPKVNYELNETINNLARFNGKVIIQSLFIRGKWKGKTIDNSSPEEINVWLKALKKIRPEKVMIYSIERDTPATGLQKIDEARLKKIAEKVKAIGIDSQVSI